MPIHLEHLAALKLARDEAIVTAEDAAASYAQALQIGTPVRQHAIKLLSALTYARLQAVTS